VRLAEPLHPGMEPFPGCRLADRLGSGGFGEVWQCEARDGTPIALKFLPCDNAHDAVTELRSIQAFLELQHPNLVQIFRVWCHLGYIVIAMELAEGSLADLFELYRTEHGTPLPSRQLASYMRQAADALDFLNTRQHLIGGQRVAIQHCDVKPNNFLLFGETLKLADYGLASAISCQLKPHRRAGTIAYTAPEVHQGRLSNWTDQFSLAVMYCELRTMRLPSVMTPDRFDAGYVMQPDLSFLPAGERSIVARALALIPQDRWPSCRHFVDLLLPHLT
jgi:serine/threonine-protein kinase